MHGTIMIFMVLTTAPQSGFGNYFLPIQIGAADMAFPKLNALSFWLLPIAGIMIADYFILRKCELDVDALYRADGKYSYTRGVNWNAIIALASGIAVALIGLIVPALRWLYDYAWFVGFFVAGSLYLLLMKKEK